MTATSENNYEINLVGWESINNLYIFWKFATMKCSVEEKLRRKYNYLSYLQQRSVKGIHCDPD